MSMNPQTHTLTAILPCSDLPRSRDFYARLGFRQARGDDGYAMLEDGRGGELHLQAVEPDWLIPGRNPCGVYLYAEQVDELAARFPGEILGLVKHPEDKPWRMYEFAVSDPDGALVRVGWPSRYRTERAAETAP